MAPKIKIQGHILALWEGHFDDFYGQKTSFLNFLRVILEQFSNILGIFYELILLPLNRSSPLGSSSPLKTQIWL